MSKTQTRPTIDEVARSAGVSTATVSRVLNKPQAVRDALRKQVMGAISRLGYVPDAGARALTLRRSGTIGAVFPTVDNAIFAKAIDALQRRLAIDGVQLLLATSGYSPESEMHEAVNLVTRGVDALVLCGFSQHPNLLSFLNKRGLPCVHVMGHPGMEGQLSVGFDNARGMYNATRYLLDLGHRHIAMLAGVSKNNDRARERIAGLRSALQDAGVDWPDSFLIESPYALAEARSGMRQLMQLNPRPTGVICGNDVLALGAMLEAFHMNLQIPEDVSVIGFDDLEMSRHLRPALTTVRVPTESLWSKAAELLLTKLRNEPVAMHTEVEVALVVRESCGPVAPKSASAAS